MGNRVQSFRGLRVYRSAVELRRRVFSVSQLWPKAERHALTDQIRRSSRSVSANVAEAWSTRRYPRHFVLKLTDAHGEAKETGVWLDTARECGYLSDEEHASLRDLTRACAGGLAATIHRADQWAGPLDPTGAVRDPSVRYIVEPDPDAP